MALCFGTELPMARAEEPSPAPSETPAGSADAAAKAADSNGDGVPDRPDLVSAGVTARVLGVAVEDMSQRSESVRVLINPDGTSEQESHAAPVWVRDADGKWVDVDYTLVPRASGGGFAPKASPSSVVIDGGGAKEFARMELPGGGSTIWSWPKALPAPTVDGSTATYAVSDGVDLLVIASGLGVSTRIRINNAEAVAPEFTVKVRTEGVKLGETDAGQLFFTDGKERAGQTSTLTAWDGRLDAEGDPLEFVPVEASLEKTGSSGSRTDQDLTLTTPPELVDDPEVVYPITIDPELTPLTPSQDTWVRLNDTKIDTASYRVVVGKVAGSSNSNQGLAFLQWPNGQISGRTILSASVNLYQYAAGSCDASKKMNIHPLVGAWDQAKTVYSNKPSINTETGTSSSLTKNVGGEGCSTPNGFVSADLSKMVQAWANGTAKGGFTNYGVQLNVPDVSKTDASFERRFCSINYDPTHTSCNQASRVPYLKIVYNSAPQAAAAPSVSASRTFAGKLWTSAATPVLTTSATDAEASKVTYGFEIRTSADAAAVTASCTTGQVAAGTAATCKPATALTNGASYVVRARATDEYGLVGPWSAWVAMGVDTKVPATPAVTCTGYANGTWTESRGASKTSCTFSASGAADYQWWVYKPGGFVEQPALVASGGAATTAAIDIPASGGYFIVKAVARNSAGLLSPEKAYSFGIGSPQLTLPRVDDRSTSTFPLQARASANPVSSQAATAEVQWRYPPASETDTTSGWTKATKVKVKDTGKDWAGEVTKTDVLTTPMLVWAASDEPDIQNPSLLQVRIVFAYPGEANPQISPTYRFQLVPHAFGGSYPTQEVGPGTLALYTGEYQVSESDVSVPGTGGDLTLGRTHGTLTGDQAGPAGIFGPGWTADIAGQGAGLAGYTVLDHTGQDGTFVLTSPEGVSDIYAHESNTSGALRLGGYVGVGETALAEDKLVLSTGTGGATHKLILTEEDGTVTEFQRNAAGVWSVARTTEPEANSTVRFIRNADGLTTWVLAPVPSQSITCSETVQERGCRALKLNYATIGGGRRLTGVQYVAWNPKPGSDGKPSTGAMDTIDVAGYGYDTAGRLVESWTPTSAGDKGADRKTTYAYTTINSKAVVEKITDPGQRPWRFGYTDGVLTGVKRELDPAVGNGDAVWTIAYDVRLTGAGLPNLQVGEVATWGQLAADAPVGGTAVFEPDHVPAASPSGDDWPYASISYFTREGRVTNTASYGAGAWQVNSTRYDDQGNTVWTLSSAGRAAALAEPNSAAVADKYAALTVYNEAGTRVEETYSPTRPVVLDNGTTVLGRTKVETVYDDEADSALMPGRPAEAPDGGYNLAVEQRTSVTDAIAPGTGSTWDTRKVRYRYDPVVAVDGDGWTLKAPTRTLSQDGSGWATSISRYDTEGKLVESRTPGGAAITNGTANDPYSTRTIYYTLDGSAADADCRNKPEWAGSTCVVKTAGDPSSGYPIPATATVGYNIHGAVTRVEQTASSWTRATVTGYDYQGRATSSSTALTDHETISGTTSYDPVTGAVTSTTRGGVTEAFTYDSWGRKLSSTDGTGNTATSSYDTAGRVRTLNDGKGTYTYTYDGTDALGKAERRGLTTKVDVGYASGDTDVVTGAYDAAGSLVQENLPGGFTQSWTRNLAGQATAMAYTQTVSGTAVPILGFSQTYDHLGRVVTSVGPASRLRYGYDDRARLTKVQDTGEAGCATRTYAFTGDSNRTSAKTYGPDGDGSCQTSSVSSSSSFSYDQADRIVGDGYAYDRMGRTKTVPKAHTNQAGVDGAGDLSVTYAANDMVASLQQTVADPVTGTARVSRQAFSLDGSDRVSSIKGYTDGVQLSDTLNHYDGSDDSPAWTQTRTRLDADAGWVTTWNRYVSGLAGGLAIDVDDTGKVVLQLSNLHGDIVAATTLGQTGLDSYSETDEYGKPKTTGATAERYGWLGTHQRDASVVGGLALMGVRLYNPVTGRFLSIDPVAGGNDNRYTYPTDPINKLDLDGNMAWWEGALLVASFIPGPIGLVASVISAGVAVARGDWVGAGLSLLGPIGRVAKYLRAASSVAKTAFKAAGAGKAGIRAARKSAAASARHFVKNGDNTLRIGGGRVSIGAEAKHFLKMGPVKRQFYRVHVHLEKSKGGITLNLRSGRNPSRGYGSWAR